MELINAQPKLQSVTAKMINHSAERRQFRSLQERHADGIPVRESFVGDYVLFSFFKQDLVFTYVLYNHLYRHKSCNLRDGGRQLHLPSEAVGRVKERLLQLRTLRPKSRKNLLVNSGQQSQTFSAPSIPQSLLIFRASYFCRLSIILAHSTEPTTNEPWSYYQTGQVIH